MADQIAINAAGGLIVEVVKGSFGFVKRHICYFFNHESKVKSLNDQHEKLKHEKESVQHRVVEARNNALQIKQVVQQWLINVDKKVNEIEAELRKYEDEAKKRCFLGLCPRFMSRYHLNKKAEMEANLVAELLTEANQFSADEIAYGPDLQPMFDISAHQRGFETFQSRDAAFQDILKALKEPSIQGIGVFGMSGVGKTMLMKEVAFIAKRDNLFDEVAIATISNSQMINIQSIQGEIADALGLKFEEESMRGRAERLRQRLNNGKKILVILDDIWKMVDLGAVGVIFDQNQNLCKLLLTSRSKNTLCLHSNVKKTFELTVLTSEESIVLFKNTVGYKVEEPDYELVAIDLVAKCAGLPVAISAVANALKEKSIDIWKNALQQLIKANPRSIEGVEENVYSALKLSYEFLQYKPAQTLLLLCSLLPQGQQFSISDLIKYSWSTVLPEDVCSMEEARGNMAVYTQELKSSSLLLSGDIDTVFRMHDVVRDVCISIAREDNQMFVFDERVRFEKLLKGRKLKKCMALSLLAYGDIGELPEKLDCPELQFFYCVSEDRSLKVPDIFFEETKKLKVLDLTGMELSSLPSSILSLTNLQTLCLNDCLLQDIAIGELKNLEVLSITDCGITKLPIQLANLSKLKLLDLSSYRLEVNAVNLISTLSNLCSLEELYMRARLDEWDVEGNASLSELKDLNKLTASDIEISDLGKIPKFQNLERFEIHIVKEYHWYDKTTRSRQLNVELDTNMYLVHGFKMLLKKTEALRFIVSLKGVMDVISILEVTRSHLKDLYIITFENEGEVTETSSLMLSLFNHKVMLCYLENLMLWGINNPNIWNNEPSTWSTNLTSFDVYKCNNLKHLFSTTMARCLKQLEDLKVRDCKSMIDIIATEMEETRDAILFPNLSSLYLEDLPKLTRFFKNLTELPALRTLSILRCQLLKSFVSDAATMETLEREETQKTNFEEGESFNVLVLFNERAMLCYLENLQLHRINNTSIWNNEPSTWPTNLTIFNVCGCNNLEHLFSTPMARCLKQLKDLKVRHCQSLIDIIATEVEERKDVILFPNLDYLELARLPKLTRFSENLIEFSSLRELHISMCDVLKSFIPNAATVETLIREETERNNLEEDKSSNISTLFNGKMLAGLQRLDNLEIKECNSVEKIFECEEPNLGKSTAVKFELPTLTELELCQLPKLRSFSCKAIECPSLITITVEKCHQVQLLFCSEEYISFGKPQQQKESQQPLFWVNKIGFPSLEEMSLKYNKNLEQIWEGQLPLQCSPKLKCMVLSSTNKLFCEELKGVLPMVQLSQLSLRYLDELIRCAWDENFEPFRQVFNKLTKLKVSRCEEFKNILVPSSISFSNLVNMTIYKCHRLISLLTHSTAKSLVLLTTMEISYCHELKEIIAKDRAKDDILFPQLKSLVLDALKRLEGFCLGNCSIKFLSLDELTVEGCPNMRIFCQGEVVTPKLQSAELDCVTKLSVDDGDLNNSIQQIYERQIGCNIGSSDEVDDASDEVDEHIGSSDEVDEHIGSSDEVDDASDEVDEHIGSSDEVEKLIGSSDEVVDASDEVDEHIGSSDEVDEHIGSSDEVDDASDEVDEHIGSSDEVEKLIGSSDEVVDASDEVDEHIEEQPI